MMCGLWFPVYLDQYDLYGVKVACGNGFSSNLNQAAQANLVTNCDTALLVRRAWAIPAVAFGWLLVLDSCWPGYTSPNQRKKPHPPELIYAVLTGQF